MDEDDFKRKVYAILKEQGLLDVSKVKFTIEKDSENLMDILAKVVHIESEVQPIN